MSTMTLAERSADAEGTYQRGMRERADEGLSTAPENAEDIENRYRIVYRDDRPSGGWAVLARYNWGSRTLAYIHADGRAISGMV